MAHSKTFPPLAGNFTPVPNILFDELLREPLDGPELTVTLFLIRATYGYGTDQTFVPLEQIVGGTSLDEAQALAGLEAGIGRGWILPFTSSGDSPGRRFFLLSTLENRALVGSHFDEDLAGEGPAAISEPPPAKVKDPSLIKAPVPAPEMAPPPAMGLNPELRERLGKLLGRSLTKAERERLDDLGAQTRDLEDATAALEDKEIEVYSSDLVIYEYESLQAARRKNRDEEKRREEREKLKVRQRSCTECHGLGYVFVGVNVIEDCACRKGTA